MRTFFGVIWYEYRMMVRRWGLWLAILVASGPEASLVLTSDGHLIGAVAKESLWQSAGYVATGLNLFMPVVGGIAIADRLQRDSNLGVYELLRSSPLSCTAYVLGKYTGTVLGVVTPALAVALACAAVLVVRGASAEIIGFELLAFFIVSMPTYAFVGAFSLACTAVLPVRVYQVLFTGYWFWGNLLNPQFLPTISHTILNAAGIYAGTVVFGADRFAGEELGSFDLAANLLALAACAAVALFSLMRYLKWQDNHA